MDLIKLSGDEWRTLVVIPAVVSLAVNLFTPLAQRAATSLLVKAAGRAHGGLSWLLKVRIRQIGDELTELRTLHSSTDALLAHYQSTVRYLSFGLWTLLLSPLLGLIAQALASKYAHHLPWIYGELFAIPGAAFVSVVAALFAAGPFQATLYSSLIKRKLKKLATDPEALFATLEKERSTIQSLLTTEPSAL
jgi:hypothetical protein